MRDIRADSGNQKRITQAAIAEFEAMIEEFALKVEPVAEPGELFASPYDFERIADGQVLSWRDSMLDQLADVLHRIDQGVASPIRGAERYRLHETSADEEDAA